MIKLHNFGVNRRTTPVGHNQSVEPQHHAGMALDSAGHVNLRDATVYSGVPVVALVNDGRTEGVTDSGVGAGQRVIEANPKRYVIWNTETLG
jgi:hypothetical protein